MSDIQTPNTAADRAEVEGFLRGFMAKALPTAPSEEDIHIPFLEMGANSLVLMEVQRAVEARFGLTISIPQFFEELTSIDALANYIVEYQVLPEVVAAPVEPVKVSSAAPVAQASGFVPQPSLPRPPLGSINAPAGELEAILTRQIESASRAINQVVAQQLQFLGEIGLRSETTAPTEPNSTLNIQNSTLEKPAPNSTLNIQNSTLEKPEPNSTLNIQNSKLEKPKPGSATVMHRMLSPLEIRARGLNAKQQAYLEALIQRYTTRTKKSKELAAQYRGVLADSRAAVGFRFTTKEMLYPITGKRAQGAKVWDIDGNEYIDITMGQGVTMFGHHPEFIDKALADPENDILLLGPRPPQTGEAAALICELTGMERVTFTNSGTEAVMAALRIARTATQRNKIVMFDNAYHGHSDNVMGRPVWQDEDKLTSVPVAPGIMQGAVDDLWLLEYGSDSALDFIRAHIDEIAAVVVEPVQSRRPDLQPREFLHELRRITEAGGALLMFDEMITGFRIHPGGAQAWFGVKADIATYGKVLAGGLPIGVVAGAARYMDAIDGGMWNYGDASYPVADRTIFGGTFCQHPAAMITTLATLRHLKEQGPALQETLNRRTDRMAAELNDFFDLEEVPIKVVHFASLFRFAFSSNLELMFYQMMEKGVFIWEWRNYFLSTAHTDADVDHIVKSVKECVFELRAGGFLAERSTPDASAVLSYPLSLAQKQLAVLAQISPEGSMAYHVSPLLRLQGHVEVAALRIAVRDVMRRHDALRTIIVGEEQRVLPLDQQPHAGLTYTDLSSDTNPEAAFAEQQAVHARRAFDLAHGPLFEAHLYRLAATDYRLLLKAHHVVVDGMSINIVVQDLAAFYTAALRGTAVELSAAPQFNDYLQWREANVFPQQRDYWLAQLSGPLPSLDLPVDRAPAQVKSFQGGRYSCDIPEALLAGVRTLSRAQGCTHFMTLFSAYSLWLHRLCAQDELLVGMPVAGRKMQESDKLVGYCTHLIPIRSRVVWQQSFAEYLKSMRGTLLQGYQNQDYPFAELIEQAPLKSLRGNFVSALFNLDRPGNAPEMAGLDVEWLTQPIHHTAFAITLNLTEVGESIVLECDYNTDLFEAASIARYVGHFLTLLEGIVANPNQTLAQLPLLDAAARQQLLVDWNDTQAAYPQTTCAHQLFEAQAAQSPEAIALNYGDHSMTYAELDAQANGLAAWLQEQGVGPEVVVGLCAERSPELVIGLLAILKAGGAYLPLDPSYPASRLNFMLSDAGVKVVLTQERLRERLVLPAGASALSLDTQLGQIVASHTTSKIQNSALPSHVAYLIYTSGSTGQPKGTLIEHRGLTNYLTWAVQRYEMSTGEGSPLHSSISFDATITSLFAPLISGKQLTLLPEGGQEIDHIRAALQSGRHWSLVKLTPAHLELLNAMIPPEQLAGLTRFVVLGGEALLERHVEPWLKYAPQTRLINEYGPTETVVGCCVFEAGSAVAETGHVLGSVPIGRPIANTQLYVLDANLQPVPVGVKGELYIGGDGVARGYHQRPELTAQRFIDIAQTGVATDVVSGFGNRLYRTGDVVRYLEDGNLVYLGRIDNQVKVRGFRIELGEIESVLAHVPGVREAVVIAQRRSDQDVRLVAYVTAAVGETLDERVLKSALAEVLPAHMVPSTFMVLPSMPLTSNGKVDRAVLPLPEGSRPDLSAAFVDPASYAEKRIAAVWRELLGVEKVGADDNFFELGGHSLLVLPLRDRLQMMFVRPISPVDIFRWPTVASQARYLSQAVNAAGGGTLETHDGRSQAQTQAQRQRDALRQMKDKRQNRG